MSSGASLRLRSVCIAVSVALLVVGTPWLSADTRTGYQPTAYAIQNAKIVASVKETIDSGTVVVRDGKVEAVGPADKVAIPFDAEVIDGQGLTIYPGFIDLYTTVGQTPGSVRSRTGSGRPVDYNDSALARTPSDDRYGLTPEFEVASALELGDTQAEERRKLGFTDLVSAPAGAIVTGQSALVSLSGLPRREVIVRSPVGLHINLKPPFEPTPPKGDDDHAAARVRNRNVARYPVVLLGVIAHLRQAMLDAEYAASLAQADAPGDETGRRPFDPSLKVLHAARTKAISTWWEANTRDEIHRALDLSEEFGTTPVIVGGREAGKVADRLKALDVPVVLRIDFPDEPKVSTEAEYRKREPAERIEPYQVLVDRGARWKERVGTAQVLAQAGVRFALSSDGITKTDHLPSMLRKLIAAGLPREAALAALTQRAAEIAGASKSLGTIEVGKLGHLVAFSAPLGDENAKVRFVLVDGLKFEFNKPDASKKSEKSETPAKPKEPEAATKAETPKTAPEEMKVKESKAEANPATTTPKAATEDAKPKESPKGDAPAAPKEKADEPKAKEVPKEPAAPPPARPKASESKPDATPKPEAAKSKAATAPNAPEPETTSASHAPDIATEFDEARKPKLRTRGNVLIKDATILTVTEEGTISKGSILVKDGKIAKIGSNVDAPKDVTVINAAGMVAMPGIIDSHSHIAVQGSVNEWSLSIVPEVRIKDVITGDDVSIYRALAGGTTTARILHGSADAIGGQDAVIKLKYGLPGRDLIIKDAPQGVKFALGENVTRNPGRFPNSRMGVESTLERAFQEARAYQVLARNHAAAQAKGLNPAPFRRDLRLEAIARILEGSIKIHSHCYRSDEILMLLRVASRHGVRVQSLQHALEGYKVAAEIAAHGASASTFSDWWAYKIEAFDAIPYNAALLTEAGASVCIKSDSDELIRHLNLEAAKMVKYGGVTEAQALAMITLNPAKELGLQDRIGSLAVGKDADISLFNRHPFDAFARCEMAIIDGEVAFQRKQANGSNPANSGEHSEMPGPSHALKGRSVEILPNAKGVYALTGARLHPVSSPDINEGTLVIIDGKITAIGGPQTPVPAGAQTIDMQGFDVWPGLIDSGTRLALFEVGSLPETQDDSDSAQFEPELRTSSALHPDSELIPVTRANGVLTAYVQPAGGLISGQGCAINLDGWVPREMTISDPLALHVSIPAYIPPPAEGSNPRGDGPDPRQKRKEQLESIREEFRRALRYDKVVTEATARGVEPPIPDARLAALVPYAKGLKPVIFRAEHRAEILDALKIASDLKLKAVISGAAEAWKVVDALKTAKVPVLVGGTLQLPSESTDPYDSPYANPARLHEAGIPFAIRSNPRGPEQATASRNLPYEAATAVAFGLPESEALKAITLNAAQILGIADQVGSLEVGKRANLVISAGNILQPTTEVKAVFINGRPVDTKSRHTRLYEKYRKRLEEIRSGQAPLGIDLGPATPLPPAASPSKPEAAEGNNQR
ncbi:amidohydrolase family protein [Singulisphaera sp. PoT]|uniref:amidohydrolase family protein n=1 Tax=Singulisphaera sp. PoT TaxID=3411797 RepID=UPI003BF602BE